MNWDALGAIGEIVGAVAVVATLLYLALQIKQNTRSQFVDRGVWAGQKLSQIHEQGAANHNLAELVAKCRNSSIENLSAGDEERLRRFANLYLAAYADIEVAHRLGLCEEIMYQAFSTDLYRTINDYPALKPYMRAIMEHFDLEAYPIFKPLFE